MSPSSPHYLKFRSVLQHYLSSGDAMAILGRRHGLDFEAALQLVWDFGVQFCQKYPQFEPSVRDDKITLARFLQIVASLNAAAAASPAASRPPSEPGYYQTTQDASPQLGYRSVKGPHTPPILPPSQPSRGSTDVTPPCLVAPVDATKLEFKAFDQNLEYSLWRSMVCVSSFFWPGQAKIRNIFQDLKDFSLKGRSHQKLDCS
jgi:hypothetical protein